MLLAREDGILLLNFFNGPGNGLPQGMCRLIVSREGTHLSLGFFHDAYCAAF